MLEERLPLYLSDGQFPENEVDTFRPFVPSKNWQYDFSVSVERYLDTLTDITSKLILIYPIPEFGFNQYNLYIKGLIAGKDINTSYDYNKFLLRSKSSYDLLDNITGENVFRIFPSQYICENNEISSGSCSPLFNNTLIYADDDHLNSIGAMLLLDDLKGFLE